MEVHPPRTELPAIEFAADAEALTPAQAALVDDLAWVLTRWGAAQVEVVAYLPTAGAAQAFNETAPGHRRASAVAAELAKSGITASVEGEFRAEVAAARRAGQIVLRPVSEAPLP